MKNKIKVKLIGLLGVFGLLGWLAVGMLTTQGCSSDDDCLVSGENCSQAYIDANYGGSASCCSGLTCTTSGGTYLICRSY